MTVTRSRFVATFAAGGVALAAMEARAQEGDPWWGRDKALHFGVSAALAAGGYAGGAALSDERWVRWGLGAGVSLGAGIGKEVLDRYTGGHPSWRDLTWDAVGTATGLLSAWLIDRLVFSRPAVRSTSAPQATEGRR